MAAQLSTIMAQLEAIEAIDTLHPRALQQVEMLTDRYGASDVAVALGWLWAQALYDLRLAQRQLADLQVTAA